MILDKNKKTTIVIGDEDGAKQVYSDVNEIAQQAEFKDVIDLTETLSSLMLSPNKAVANEAFKKAKDFTSKFTLLTLYQELISFTDQGDYMDILSMYDDGEISAGNTKSYITQLKTGKSNYDRNGFVPTKQTKKFATPYDISIYKIDGTGEQVYSTEAFEFFKEMTIQDTQWVPYFISGTLAQFVSELAKEISTVYRWYSFDKLATLISTSTPANSVVGTATNAFDAIVTEFLPLIAEMGFLSSNYNYSKDNKVLQILPSQKLTLYMSSKVKQMLNTGIKSQLFNAQLMNEGTILDSSSIRCLGNKIVIGDDETVITVSDDPYIDDNTIFIVAEGSIKIVKQITKEGHQEFAKNHTLYTNQLVIGAMDILPSGGIVKYTNTNLTTLPN